MRTLGLLLVAAISLAPSDPRDLGTAVENQLDLVQVDRRILLIGPRGLQRELQLEIGERVLELQTRGLVAVVRTDARILGTTTELGSWQQLRYRVKERASPPEESFLGDRVALVSLENRVVAMSTTTSSWQELEIGPREPRGPIYTGTNVVVVLTERRAIAFAPGLGSFAEIALTPRESIEDVSLQDSSATLTTPRRVLIFRAGNGSWTDVPRSTGR